MQSLVLFWTKTSLSKLLAAFSSGKQMGNFIASPGFDKAVPFRNDTLSLVSELKFSNFFVLQLCLASRLFVSAKPDYGVKESAAGCFLSKNGFVGL